MALFEIYPSGVGANGSKVNIICVPAIGADPRTTWSTDAPTEPHPLCGLHEALPNADILLYDHLTAEERSLEIKPQGDAEHQASAEAFADAGDKVAQYGVTEWADRFLQTFGQRCRSDEVGHTTYNTEREHVPRGAMVRVDSRAPWEERYSMKPDAAYHPIAYISTVMSPNDYAGSVGLALRSRRLAIQYLD
ncbi:MAG: hypothetical protein L6R42_009286 [Xanthoria sp. 1 TBL-2021]|nr:MAG: hypothetical protein L6R42_009286 [Xanthoria sp. 1 TBL-2021]